MIKATYSDFSQDVYQDIIAGERIKGGYGVPEDNEIYIDLNLPIEKQPLTIIHEALNIHLKGKVRHPLIDAIGIDVIDCLQQLGFEIIKNG